MAADEPEPQHDRAETLPEIPPLPRRIPGGSL